MNPSPLDLFSDDTSIDPALYFYFLFFLHVRARQDAALSDVCSLHKRPSRLFVSVRLVALARRRRPSSVLHWVVPPLEVRA